MSLSDYPSMIKDLVSGNIAPLSSSYLSEEKLKELAELLTAKSLFKTVILRLFQCFEGEVSREFDWNCGSLIQHADSEVVFSQIPMDGSLRLQLIESIGLTWCLGQFHLRDQRVVDFLEETVEHARNPQSWWRAAFSLELLGLVNAVSYLKSALKYQGIPKLHDCLAKLGNERSRIGILLHINSSDVQEYVFPRLKDVVCSQCTEKDELLAAVWLIARLNYHDQEIRIALKKIALDSDYETQFYTVSEISKIGSVHFIDELIILLQEDDPHLRKMAARGLGRIDDPRALAALRTKLRVEQNEVVLSALTEALYESTNYSNRYETFIARTVGANENGMISNVSDKWYGNPSIYHEFSSCQDPENICFSFLSTILGSGNVVNPVDLGCGTGRLAWYVLDHCEFEGKMFCIDSSGEMCKFMKQRAARESISRELVEIVNVGIKEAYSSIGEAKSSVVMANFAFPSRYSDNELIMSELESAYRCLAPTGKLITFGWDESFNDELSEMWYRFIPDGIKARNFEEWRTARSKMFLTPRNCKLTWFRRGLKVPLLFPSLDSSARVIGYLFGRSAVSEVVRKKKVSWTMSLGITVDSREHIAEILNATA
jgi:SAM-dependent methyltransferase